MRNHLLLHISILILLWQPINLFAQSRMKSTQTILLDPGHGGKDPGAIGKTGLMEKDVVLALAQEINSMATGDSLMEIYLTRYTDGLVPLKQRTSLSKHLNADLFVSLHCNHSDNPNAKGVEIFVANTALTENLATSIFLAQRISELVVQEIGIKSRGVKFQNFQVLRETINHSPSLLLEICFLSNINEENFLLQQKSITAIASLLYKIFKTYLTYD